MKARCSGCGLSGVPRPSTVVTRLPATAQSGVSQEATACPSISTLQAPHWLAPQPKCVPVSPSGPRSTSSSFASGDAATSRACPLIVSRIGSLIASIDPGARNLHDTRPFLDVGAQVLVELLRRHRHRLGTLLRPHLLDVG